MKRRQFLAGMLAVPAACLLPRFDDRFEIEKWFEREQPTITSFATSGLEVGDYIKFSGAAEDYNGLYQVTEVKGGSVTYEPA